jgi:cyclomaltodextrinase
MRRLVALVALVLGCGDTGAVVELDRGPGPIEAWAFEAQVAGAATGCGEVTVTSARGTVRAPVVGGRFASTVPLGAGEGDVTATCGGVGAAQRWNVRIPDVPRAFATATVTGGELRLSATASPSPVGGAAIAGYEWRARSGALAGLPASGEVVTVPAPTGDGEHVIDLIVTDAAGASAPAAVRVRVEDGVARVPSPAEAPPWLDDAVVYGYAPYFAGDGAIDDLIPRLDALVELGVTVIWLSPIMEAEAGDYGYATTDHFRVREDFGGEAALSALVEAAHARGVRVILDLIANHTSIEHAYVATRPELYAHDDAGALEHYFDWENLPNVDCDQPEVRAWMAAAFVHWARDLDVDGFRADASWGPAERCPSFWPAVLDEVRRLEPGLFWLSEASARDPSWVGRFHAAYDWTDELGQWAWKPAFDEVSAPRLRAALTGHPAGIEVFRFLDNNDTGPRFVTQYGPARVPASAAVLFTVPGVPSLWIGSEVGAEFEPYDEGPPVTWVDRHGLTPIYARLADLRHGVAALRGDDLILVDAEPAERVVAYVRPGAAPVLVVVDLAGQGGDVAVALTPEVEAVLATQPRDLFHDEAVTVTTADGRVNLTLPDDGVRILGSGYSPAP